MNTFGELLLRATISAVLKPTIRKAMGLGPDKRSFIEQVAHKTIAKTINNSILGYPFAQAKSPVSVASYTKTIESNEYTELEDCPHFLEATFPNETKIKCGSEQEIDVEEKVKEFVSEWLEDQESEMKRKLLIIKGLERKLRLYILDEKQRKGMSRRIKQIDGEIQEIKEWINEVEKDGPDIFTR